jgi:uncharacterized protein (TIGR02145 family)
MADGNEWMTRNLDVDVAGSFCYADAEEQCQWYGRLYTWHAAERACAMLGGGWRLPTNEEWGTLARRHGGLREESDDTGRAAYKALMTGGGSGFNALLGGGRNPDGKEYARLGAHGFYWTSTGSGDATAWFYNFGKGQLSLGRHRDGEKSRAFSVRCVRA